MERDVAICVLSVVIGIAGCSSSVATCVPGTTQTCFCAIERMGIQTCGSSGAFDTCQCMPNGADAGGGRGEDAGAIVDGGVDVDAARCAPLAECEGRCVDTSTDESSCGGCGPSFACDTGSFCVSGVCTDAGCSPPFLVCGGDCVDPRTNPTYCGATGDCSGASQGETCGGACWEGRCVAENCSDVLRQGASTGDGLYLVDVDGTGPLTPREVYCDMTTAGGGWTLVYKIRNDVPDISDPWWGMVGIGSGDAFPVSPTVIPSGSHFEGPTRDVRWTYYLRGMSRGVSEYRGTLLSREGEIVVDVYSTGYRGPIHFAATGRSGVPDSSCTSDTQVISAAAGVPFTAGASLEECYSMASGRDIDMLYIPPTTQVPVVGDTTIDESGSMFASSTTLFWIRQAPAVP